MNNVYVCVMKKLDCFRYTCNSLDEKIRGERERFDLESRIILLPAFKNYIIRRKARWRNFFKIMSVKVLEIIDLVNLITDDIE